MDDAPAGVGAGVGVGVGVGNGGGGGGGGGVVSDMESQGTANVWKAATMKDIIPSYSTCIPRNPVIKKHATG